MNGSSKVLTVSYGTFSCALEGFEDPFSAMTSIVEYFQNLTKCDPHFGSQPLQPDLEVLRQLASQKGQEVEAEQTDSESFILRSKAQPEVAPKIAITADLPIPSGVAGKLARLRDAVLMVVTQSRLETKAALQSDPQPELPPEPQQAEVLEAVVAPEGEVIAQAAAEHNSELAPEALPEVTPQEPLHEKVERARARVIRIRRHDLVEAQSDEAQPLAPQSAHPAQVQPAGSIATEGGLSRMSLVSGAGQDVDRLMRQVEAQMALPFNQRRVASIQHLKAAVAAKVAEGRAQEAPAAAPPVLRVPSPHLTQAALPEVLKPAVEKAEVEKPEAALSRATPLVLVATQRVDGAVAKAAVSDDFDLSLKQALQQEADAPKISFAEYAQKKQIGNHMQRLDVAARYLVEVEKRAVFERLHVMRLANSLEADPAAVAREDGLRAFGSLLRIGRIVKSGRGTYALAEGNWQTAS